MKIYVRDVKEVYETRVHKPFMYKDVMYCTVRKNKKYRKGDTPYKYHIVHVLTGQFICTCKTKKVKNNIARLIEQEEMFNKTVADALTERFGDNPSANINVDQWNKLITRLEK